MPLPVDNLTPESSTMAIRDAINRTIKQLIDEGKTPEEAAGQAYGMARDKTGKALNEGRQK